MRIWLDQLPRRAAAPDGLHEALAELTAISDVDRCSLLVPAGADALRVLASSDSDSIGDVIVDLARYPELRQVMTERQPILVADVEVDDSVRSVRELLVRAGVRGLAAAPMAAAGVPAILRLASRHRTLTPHDLAVLEVVAHHLELSLPAPDTRVEKDDPLLALLERLADAVLEVAADGRILAVFGTLPDRLGVQPASLVGRHLEDLVGESESTEVRAQLVALLTGESTRRGARFRIRLPGQAPLTVRLWGARTRDAVARAWIAATFMGCSGSREEEVITAIPVPTLLVSRDNGTVLSANSAAERLAGRTTAELTGLALDRVLRTAGGATMLRHGRGHEVPVEVVDSRSLAELGPIPVVLLDRSEANELDRQRSRMQATLSRQTDALEVMEHRLEQAEAMRSRFLSASAHELKTPLTVIESYLETLLSDLADGLGEEQLAFLRIAHESTLRMRRLVVDLVDLAALESGLLHLDIERVEVAPTVRTVIEEMAPIARRAAAELISTDLADLPPARADSLRLQQIVRNLIDNALRFSPPQGLVTVTGGATADAVTLEVRDEGPGIPAELLPVVFEQFVRAPSSRTEGTGLGLAICRRIALALGGRIEAANAPSGGAVLTLALPRWPEDPGREPSG